MKPEIKKLLILNLPYLLFVWLFDKVGAAVRLSPGADASAKLLHLGDGFTTAFSSIAPSFHPADLLIGIAGAVIVRLIIYTKGKNAKKYRRGTEYGSARWGGADDIKPYTDPVFENNIPLTQTERLTMNSRPKQPKYARNKNILVIGGSGSGKTRFFVKPSLMQCTSKDSFCAWRASYSDCSAARFGSFAMPAAFSDLTAASWRIIACSCPARYFSLFLALRYAS